MGHMGLLVGVIDSDRRRVRGRVVSRSITSRTYKAILARLIINLLTQ